VISRTHADFWTAFNALPVEVQQQARERFRLWQQDAFNPMLHFSPCSARFGPCASTRNTAPWAGERAA